jgi:hypothetical protein
LGTPDAGVRLAIEKMSGKEERRDERAARRGLSFS